MNGKVRWFGVVLGVCLAGGACSSSPKADSAPPEGSEESLPPADVTVTSEDESNDKGTALDMDHQREQAMTAAKEGLGNPTSMVSTLVFPSQWPPTEITELYFFVYPVDAPPDTETHSLSGPPVRVQLDPATGGLTARPQDERGGPATFAHREVEPKKQQRYLKAEAALIDVVTGRRTLEDAKTDLEGYREWLVDYPSLTKDLKERFPLVIPELLEKPEGM